jgi:hypothetical protein
MMGLNCLASIYKCIQIQDIFKINSSFETGVLDTSNTSVYLTNQYHNAKFSYFCQACKFGNCNVWKSLVQLVWQYNQKDSIIMLMIFIHCMLESLWIYCMLTTPIISIHNISQTYKLNKNMKVLYWQGLVCQRYICIGGVKNSSFKWNSDFMSWI